MEFCPAAHDQINFSLGQILQQALVSVQMEVHHKPAPEGLAIIAGNDLCIKIGLCKVQQLSLYVQHCTYTQTAQFY